MNIYDYETENGKNVIKTYLSSLDKESMKAGYRIRHEIILRGLEALNQLSTRQLNGKLWEIKFYQHRIMYVLVDENNIYFLHACKKQKGKAEKFELDTAVKRAKEAGIII